MHYIRFLKAPKIDIQKQWVTVRTLITITTDLGDDFLAADIPIYALLIRDGDEPTRAKKKVLATGKATWKRSTRALWLETPRISISVLESPVRLLISTSSEYLRPLQIQLASLDYLPKVWHAWSEPFDLKNNGTMTWIERRVDTSETISLHICEEIGESIARHIWDAGVTLSAFIRDIILLPRFQDEAFPLARKLRKPSGPRIIEVGSGCGIVGLQVAQACPKAHVLLTDLPEAMEVLERNISIATPAPGTDVQKTVLNWDEEVPEAVAKQTFDLVLVSDCTYNSDSIPALVRTLASLIERSPGALVVVSMKVRHESEAVFHELVHKAGLYQQRRWSFKVPNLEILSMQKDYEMVDIYVYQSRNSLVEEARSDVAG